MYFNFISILIAIFLDCCYGVPYSVRYNAQKTNILTLLTYGTSASVFTEGISSIVLTDSADQTTLNNWVTNVEANVIQNRLISPASARLARLATELDIFFIQNPTIQNRLIYRMISSWGPVANFQYITDESNIDYFWELASTPGANGCKIYDILLDLTKDNPAVQKKIYTKNVPCNISYEMASRMANMIYDVPADQRNYLKSLILPNGISFNQFLRIAAAYFTTSFQSCQRILQITANAQYVNMNSVMKGHMSLLMAYFSAQFTPDKTVDDCIAIVSNNITGYLDDQMAYGEMFTTTTWEPPFGTFFEIIIFNECQISVLKSKAATYYP